MVIVACEQFVPAPRRLVDDHLAAQFLPPAARLVTRACRFSAIRAVFMKAAEKAAPGLWGGIVCRKRYIDERTAAALAAGAKALVILGAGLDTRACRFAVPLAVPSYEVDLPPNIEYKRAQLLARYGRIPGHMTLVPLDLEKADLGSALAAVDFQISQRTIFIWEGVTQYLTAAAVRNTLRYLSRAGAGSSLVFTYVRKDFLDGEQLYGAEKMYNRFVRGGIWHLGLAPDAVDSLLQEYGWMEREQAGAAEFRRWYLDPAGRHLPLLEIERCVWAIKQ